jgi:hypothetical protein
VSSGKETPLISTLLTNHFKADTKEFSTLLPGRALRGAGRLRRALELRELLQFTRYRRI